MKINFTLTLNDEQYDRVVYLYNLFGAYKFSLNVFIFWLFLFGLRSCESNFISSCGEYIFALDYDENE